MMRAALLLLAVLTVALTAAAETTLSVGEMTVDGQVMQDLSCKLSKGGFLVTAVLVGTIAKHKAALDRCGPAGEAFRVSFTWSGSKTTDVQVLAASREKGKQCVASIFRKMRPTLEGTCTAVVLTGDVDAARAAATKLPRPSTGEGGQTPPPSQ